MTKIAVLPSGETLRFPPTTSREAIELAVKNHAAGKSAQGGADQKPPSYHADQSEALPRMITQEHTADRQQRDAHHNDKMMMSMGAHTQKTQSDEMRNGHLNNISALLGHMANSLQGVSQMSPILEKLVSSIDALTAEVKASAAQMIDAHTAEKTLKFDARGRPSGLKSRYSAPSVDPADDAGPPPLQ